MSTTPPIDAVIHHAMVLVARLAIADGRRAPLAAIPGRAFVELSAALVDRGLGDAAVADLFGLSPGAWRARLRRRRTAPRAASGDAVLMRLERDGRLSRRTLAAGLAGQVDGAALDAALGDLVDRGLVYRTGSGPDARFGVMQPGAVARALGPVTADEIAAVEHFAAVVAVLGDAIEGAIDARRPFGCTFSCSRGSAGPACRSRRWPSPPG